MGDLQEEGLVVEGDMEEEDVVGGIVEKRLVGGGGGRLARGELSKGGRHGRGRCGRSVVGKLGGGVGGRPGGGGWRLVRIHFLEQVSGLVCSQGQSRNMAELPGTDTKDMRYHTARPCLADQEFLKFK